MKISNIVNYLKPEEFLAIVIWKSNRAKTKFKNKIKGRTKRREDKKSPQKNYIVWQKTVEKNEEKMLGVIAELSGIGIPTASAILTVCYPNYFTIIDYRAKESLMKYLKEYDYKKIFGADPRNSKKAYLKYCKLCRDEVKKLKK